MGVVICEDVLDIDVDFLQEYTSALKALNVKNFRLSETNGQQIAINDTGFEFPSEDVKIAPQRFTNLRQLDLPIEIKIRAGKFIDLLEDAIYSALVEYCTYFPDASTTAWWRPHGHIAMYGPGQRIGPHCDDQIPYKWGEKSNNQVSIHNSTSINLYLNDWASSNEITRECTFTGGELYFPLIDYKLKPKAGSIALYPSNYLGTHEVKPVLSGERFAYLTMACYGTSLDQEEFVGQENNQKIWMPDIFKRGPYRSIQNI
jgi:hypothetical protein